MFGKTTNLLLITKLLLACIFCGVIVGETVSLTMAVTVFGSELVGKLYLVNALLLLSLPILFFKYIDIINRGKLLAVTTFIVIIILFCFTCIYQLFNPESAVVKMAAAVIYPVSYLSKTILFLTYWTYLNDLFSIQEAKKHFPVIAAWGFAGAVIGVVIARLMVTVFSVPSVMILWIAVYGAAYYLATRLRYRTKRRLRVSETIPVVDKRLFGISALFENKLIVLIAFIYFGTFLSVFLMDFLFWKNCFIWCKTAQGIASFQFTFFILHATVTIALLRFVLPSVINRIGFTRVMYGLPLLFISGGLLMLFVEKLQFFEHKIYWYAGIQFFRHLLFELTFASSYQMFFAVVAREQRGRAKTLLDGMVKPAAIFTSGLMVIFISQYSMLLLSIIVAAGIFLTGALYYLRLVYIKVIMKDSIVHMEISDIISSVGQTENAAFYRMVHEFAASPADDMKVMAVHLLRKAGTTYAFEQLVEIYKREKSPRVRELIARSLDAFYGYRTRTFVEQLLHENNIRIRANAINAVNQMQCNWKRHLKPMVVPLLFERDLRVQIEAAVYIWSYGASHDRSTVHHLLKNLLDSSAPNRQAAGVYLAGLVRVDGWEDVLLSRISPASLQVFTKAVEVIMTYGSSDAKRRALLLIDALPRKYCSVACRIIEKDPVLHANALIEVFPAATNRRFTFEIVACLRKAADAYRLGGKKLHLTSDAAQRLRKWILTEIELIYNDAFMYQMLLVEKSNGNYTVLETALRDRQTRLCGWAIAAMTILDAKGIFIWRSADMDVGEWHRRVDLIEVLESMPQDKIGLLVLPLLKVDEWDTLVKFARLYFHCEKKANLECADYFLRSENKLIVVSFLYTIEKNRLLFSSNLIEIQESLRMLEKNGNEPSATAAGQLLSGSGEPFDKHSRAFELLERVLFFKKCPMFRNISADKLLRVVELAHLVHFKKHEVLSVAGRLSDQLYLVKTGRIRIEQHVGGNDVIEGYAGIGETYGEAGLFSNVSRANTAVAHESTDVYIVKRTDMKHLIREIPEISLNLLETFSEMVAHRQESGNIKIKNAGIEID